MDTFPLLQLPAELRLRVYGFALLKCHRVVLDPGNYYFPLPYTLETSTIAKTLLQVNRQVHTEIIQYIFSRNIISIIRPVQYRTNILLKLGPSVHNHIRTIEFHIPVGYSLCDLGRQWETMNNCPNLMHLRLVYYHADHWWSAFGEFAHYVSSQNEDLVLNLELYTSVVASGWRHYDANYYVYNGIREAMTRSMVHELKLPKQLCTITLTVSAKSTAAQDLLRSAVISSSKWDFRKLHYQKGPPEMTSLRWCKRSVIEAELLHREELNVSAEDECTPESGPVSEDDDGNTGYGDQDGDELAGNSEFDGEIDLDNEHDVSEEHEDDNNGDDEDDIYN